MDNINDGPSAGMPNLDIKGTFDGFLPGRFIYTA